MQQEHRRAVRGPDVDVADIEHAGVDRLTGPKLLPDAAEACEVSTDISARRSDGCADRGHRLQDHV